jgi:hypothetical protein
MVMTENGYELKKEDVLEGEDDDYFIERDSSEFVCINNLDSQHKKSE